MQSTSFYIINGITLYRLLVAPYLVYLVFTGQIDIYKWMLGISYFTDLIDGYLARTFKVTSKIGSQIDSIADDLTIVASVIGLYVFRNQFFEEEFTAIAVLLSLFLVQTILALVRYKKTTSYHTYFAKTAAILQGSFFIFSFFVEQPLYGLFYVAASVTAIELIEEIILIFLLPQWETNVKGVYWVLKKRKSLS